MADHYRKTLKVLSKRPGWTIEIRRGGHLKITATNCEVYFTSATPSDWRAQKNMEAWVKRQDPTALEGQRKKGG